VTYVAQKVDIRNEFHIYGILLLKRHVKKPFVIFKCTWKDNIKSDCELKWFII